MQIHDRFLSVARSASRGVYFIDLSEPWPCFY